MKYKIKKEISDKLNIPMKNIYKRIYPLRNIYKYPNNSYLISYHTPKIYIKFKILPINNVYTINDKYLILEINKKYRFSNGVKQYMVFLIPDYLLNYIIKFKINFYI